MLSPFLDNFDENNDVTVISGIHEEKDLTTIVQSLMCAKVFLNLMIIAAILYFLNQEMFYIVKTTPNLLNILKNICNKFLTL